MMSGKPAVPRARPGESISSFSEASFNSEVNLQNTLTQVQREKIEKLEDKLAGYRTVVKQFPKLKETIVELQRKQEEQEKELTYHRANEAEQEKRILILEKLLRERKQGLADLDASSQREAFSQNHSSPSFEIIRKSSTREEISQMQEVGTSSQAATIEAVDYSPRSSHRNITASSQQQTHDMTSVSRDLPFQSLKIEKTTTANVVGPPQNPVGPFRQLSANVSASDYKRYYLNNLSSCLASVGDITPIVTSASGNENPIWLNPIVTSVSGNKNLIWQMDPEAVANKSGPTETNQQLSGIASTQAKQNLGDSANQYQTANITSTAVNTFIQTGASDTGTRPKEWKPLNIGTSQATAYSAVDLVKPSTYGTTQQGNQTPVKTQENARNELISFHNASSPKSNQTHNQNVSNMKIKMGENLPENQRWNNGCDDLMTFPSLNTNSSSPVSEQNGITRAANPIYSQQNSAVMVPADEQLCLTNQVESMAAILEKSDSPVGISDMLYKFAEAAKNMESQLNDYKALVQRQQTQIQQFQRGSGLSQGEENAKLREEISLLKSENDSLLEFIGTSKEIRYNQMESGLVAVFAAQSSADPVRAHYPDSPMMKKIESLSNINARLFQANKDWHSKWEVLRQQTQEEKADLEGRVQSLETMNKNLQENMAALEKELQSQNNSVQDLAKANESVEEEKSALQRLNETLNAQLSNLKTEVKDLIRNKRLLESELASLKDSSRNAPRTGSREYQTEIGLLKQQLTVFAEDFEKERQDRMLAEKKAEKLRKERDQIKASLDVKLKKISVQLRAQEEDLRTKARQNADLLYQVDDLKLKLQREQRKNALAAHNSCNYQAAPPSYQGPMAMAYNSDMNGHMTNPNMGRSGFSHQNSPEHLPGAWKCRHCTYINYPNRTVCDICGFTNSSGESLGMGDSVSGRNELQSRGEDRRWKNTEDIVVDHEPETVNFGSVNMS